MVDINLKKKFMEKLGFSPKNNSKGIYQKKYSTTNYLMEVDFEKKLINYGEKIKSESKTTQNFSQEENWVVLECVNRLLDKGYNPKDLILEKVYPTGHGTSGRLDILVKKNKKAYLMIECKTFGSEFKKEFQNLKKKGGQLFTYFQQDRNVEYLILYTSKFEQNKIEYINEIVKIEDSYRETSNLDDFFDRWSKLTSQNGLFEDWVNAYEFKSKALTLNQLKTITQTDSSFIFNRFLEILRHNVVLDKPNAFNKIFTLFLCKIVDENRNPDEQLDFQWIEGVDDNISFQKRLIDLYKKGMQELLSKEVTDISDEEFNKKYGSLDDTIRENILREITKIRLQKNNEFAIKEVFDGETFEENAKVLKEIVELLQIYKIRYAEKQQYLSDFFELLLTTGLKQESGQFFTPVPVARFICRSIPLNKVIQSKLLNGNSTDLLPTTMDYAAGSGHFLTESMNEIQNIIQNIDETKLRPQVKSDVSVWKVKPYSWAYNYIYGIEKDYRLVKTAKVGCYLHGDGVAQVIHTDGLNNFNHTKEYKNKLKGTDKNFQQDNKKFDIVISNPPFAVSAFKTNLKREFAEKDFELYKYLTDQSKQIECLFIERTKQLLKDDGIAGIILPSSILDNTGIENRTREVILKYFTILGITKLGSNTFMATGINTVILFLKRKNNYDWINIKNSVERFSSDLKDITVNKIENIFSKYVKYVWKDISLNDYISIFKKKPNGSILNHDIYKEYQKLKINRNAERISKIIELEKEKLLYFILTYPQKIVLVKSGDKNIEKSFLGYEFSNRRGREGIHPIQRGKSIDECTKLFDPSQLHNPKKASTYILDAYENKFNRDIDEELKEHISKIDLIDMIIWDRIDFEKKISLNNKKQINFEKIWNTDNLISLNRISIIEKGTSITKEKISKGEIPVIAGGQKEAYYHNKSNRNGNVITVSASGAYAGFINYFERSIFASDCNTIKSKQEDKISTKLIFYFLKLIQNEIYELQRGQAQPHVYGKDLEKLKIPLPSKSNQEKIIKELGKLEIEEKKAKNKINELIKTKNIVIEDLDKNPTFTLPQISENLDNLRKPITKGYRQNGKIPYYGASGIVDYVDQYILDDYVLLISEDGANLKSRVSPIAFSANGKIWVNNHAHILKFKNKSTHKLVEIYLNKVDLSEFVTGQAQPKLNQNNLNSIKIPLPSLQEQIKIAKQIEKIETVILKCKKQIEKISELKEKILKKYL